MSKKCKAYSESKLGLEPADNRRAFYAGWDAAMQQPAQQGCDYCNHQQYAGTKCKNCGPEQPAQDEPVEWLTGCPECGMDSCECGSGKFSPQAQVQVPVTDNTYGYAKSLAEAIFKQHFASDEHYASGRVVWGVNDTVIGILTQIDNMVADMVRRPEQQEPVGEVLNERGEVDWISFVPPAGTSLYTRPQAREPLTADDLREPKNGTQWRVEWWNESCRMMLPSDAKLDSFTSYKNGTMQFTIKKAAHGIKGEA